MSEGGELWRPGLRLFFASTGVGAALALILRFVPGYLESLGASPSEIGLTMSGARLGGLLALPIAGLLAERTPRGLLVTGAALQSLGLAGLGVAAPEHAEMAAAAGLLGAGTTLLDVTLLACLARASGRAHRTTVFAYYFVWVNFARNIVGSTLGEVLIAKTGLGAACLVFAAAGALHVVYRAASPVPAGAEPADTRAVAPRESLREALRPGGLLVLGLFVLLGATFGAQESFVSALAAERGFSGVTPFYVAYFALIVAGRTLLSQQIDRIGRGRIVAASASILAVFSASMAVVTREPIFIALGAVSGIGHALLWPALYASAYDRIRGAGVVSALLSATLALAGSLAELGLGKIADGWGYVGLYGLAGALAALAAVLAAALVRGRPGGG